ncbi:LysR family transcriptional regulator [Patulibacter sp.]|uniref:LysR family transcriptional regulator n=1 Tax=Patulibacter sp. TaxID=1912859 RepID=UPI002721E182|nr:LysR substrate-binding domain-containing protein [Patulibacter sp.]MDO9409061.1 LysR substrate-binding domain-containing protein [Patulibacter sp.]
MDLDLRKLRYFVAVAEERHFGRAAERLFIAQPVLSRQVRALERELGCTLLERTTRSVALTPAGEQLLAESRDLLGGVDAAVRRVLEKDRGVERLVVAFSPGLHVADAVRSFAASHPDVEIELLRLEWFEQDAPLRDGRADVGLLRRPFDDAGLRTEPIGSEEKVACLPASHPLARRTSIAVADLEGETIFDGRVRRASSLEEKFELIASGEGIALVPLSVARSYTRPDLVLVPVRDLARVETCLAVAKGRRERRVVDFLRLATEILREPPVRLAAVAG